MPNSTDKSTNSFFEVATTKQLRVCCHFRRFDSLSPHQTHQATKSVCIFEVEWCIVMTHNFFLDTKSNTIFTVDRDQWIKHKCWSKKSFVCWDGHVCELWLPSCGLWKLMSSPVWIRMTQFFVRGRLINVCIGAWWKSSFPCLETTLSN